MAKNTVLALSFLTTTCAYGIIPVSNFQHDGFPVLVPEVRSLTPGDTVFRIPDRFTVAAPPTANLKLRHLEESLRRFEGVRLKRSSARRAVCRLVLTEDHVPDHPEGYALDIDADGIRIAARTEQGLFYGVQTLRNMLRNIDTPELPGVSIVDYPDLDLRGYTFNLRFTRSEHLPSLFRIIDAMASLKLNFLMIEFGDNYPLEGNPFSLREHTFSRADIEAIRDFCRERHIQIGIRLQVLSHVRWMETHPEFESMLEGVPSRPWNAAYCPQNELAKSLVEQTLREQLSFFRPRLGYIVYDEITSHCPFQVCEKCKARDGVELLAEHLEFATRIVEEEGALTLVTQDSFLPGRLHGEELARHLDPERHAVVYWKYEPDVPEEPLTRFSDQGHPTLGLAIAGNPYNLLAMARLQRKHQTLGCYMTYWYYSRGDFIAPERNTAETYGGIVLGANYLWNLDGTPIEDVAFDPTFEWRRRLDTPDAPPSPGEIAAPVPIGYAVNTALNLDGAFPRLPGDTALQALRAALAGLPERFELLAAEGGHYYGIVLSGARGDGRPDTDTSITVGRKAERLSFLLTASRPDHQGNFFGFRHYGRNVYRFNPVADLTLVYADGTEYVRPLRYRFGITDWNRLFGGYAMRFAVVHGLDDREAYYSVGIHDLRNPHPEKEIDSIRFSTRQWAGIAPALLAVSAFGLERGFSDDEQPGGEELEAIFMRAETDTAARAPEKETDRMAVDFEDGVGDVYLETLGAFDGTVEKEIVSDPTSPSGGKVLKITVPPARSPENYPFVRVSVDLPYHVQQGAKSIRVDHRISHPEHLHYLQDYLVRTEVTPRMYWFGRSGSDTRWVTSYFAFDTGGRSAPSSQPLEDKEKADLRRVSFFFREVPEPVTLWVDRIGDSTEDRHTLPLRTVTTRKEPF